MKRKILIALALVFIIIQFFQPTKNKSNIESSNQIFKVEKISNEVQTILKTSCFDCHSNNTVYPWYNNIAPVSWWLSHHINEAKEELNFDEWASYSVKRKLKKVKEMKEEIEEGEMPLTSYTLIHQNTKLDSLKSKILLDWLNSLKQKTNEH